MGQSTRRLTVATIRRKGDVKLARWASADDTARRLRRYIRRLAKVRQPQGIETLRAKRRWRQRPARGCWGAS